MAIHDDLSENEWKEIGNRIKLRRKSCGIKQNELAEYIDISTTHMSSIENGRQHPSVYVLIKLSEQLRVTPDYFLLGYIHQNNVPKNIYDLLSECSKEDILIIRDIIEVFRQHKQ